MRKKIEENERKAREEKERKKRRKMTEEERLRNGKIQRIPKRLDADNRLKEEEKKRLIQEEKDRIEKLIKLIKAPTVDEITGGVFDKQYSKENLNNKITLLENELKKMKDLNKELINKNKKLEKEIIDLKNKNLEYEKIINEQKTTIENFNKNLSLFDGKKNNVEKEILELVKELRNKEKEIQSLKSAFPFEIKQGEKLMSVIFISADQKIHHSFICKNTDMFINIEKSLYDIYPEYRESENYFLLRGVKINKYKSLENNNIKDSDIITLNQYN